ncbi:hypothetical protein KJ652_00300 [Patescibacteria group bacterium]|nr:hypothetical protein [Patescibacteria group bacterium]
MQKSCTQCGSSFEITQSDLEFYDKISPVFNEKKHSIPAPTYCPDCRMKRRFTFRNFFNLYKRKSDLSGKDIISMYDKDSPFPVFDQHEWWGDKWNGIDYGKDIDFNQSFFEQLKELHNTVPHMGIMNTQSENTDYSNLCFQSRNCYLVFGSVLNEDCCYGHIVWQCRNCFDCLYTYRSEFCYECIDCVQCYNTLFSQSSENCNDSYFLVNCHGCRNCFGCVGMNNNEYCIFNEQISKEEYKSRVDYLLSHLKTIKSKLEELRSNEIVKNFHGYSCENVQGDYLYFSRNIVRSYDLKNCEDCKYCATCDSFKDCYDCNYSPPHAEVSYESITISGFHYLFCHRCLGNNSDILYCDDCHGCRNCFGCFGLKQKEYCILNKQYSKEQYEDLSSRLIDHMINTKEWGEFASITPFAYNETIAHQYFPLSQEQALKEGYRWKDKEDEIPQVEKIIPADRLPVSINDIPDDILNWAIKCEATQRPFRIVKQELEFYRKMKLPIPRFHPDERHKRRIALRNPRKLWQRKCDKCGEGMETTYAPERPERVFCEKCYLNEVY